MTGPRIVWDAHNYLALDLQAGPSYEDDVTELSGDEYEAAQKVVEELGGDVTINWEDDPLKFAKNLEEAGARLKEICKRVAECGVPASHFHFRSDID